MAISDQLFNMSSFANNPYSVDNLLGNAANQATTPDSWIGGLSGAGQQVTPNSDSMFSWLNSDNLGLINSGVNALGGVFNAYQGMKGLDLAKDQFNFNKSAFLTNLANQANLTNERLATRQATRLRSQGVPEDQIQGQVDAYMQKYGAKSNLGG